MKLTVHRVIVVGLILSAPVVTGCSYPKDERLAQFAEQTMREQSLQNQRMATQSTAIVDEGRQLAETAKELVTHDAQARQDLIEHHAELSSQLNSQQAKLDQQRQALAQQIMREPVVAAAISSAGILLACALQLALAGLFVWQVNRQTSDDAALVGLLVDELTTETPLFLASPVLPRLNTSPSIGLSGLPQDDSEPSAEFPF